MIDFGIALQVVLRWMHIFSAITVVGGTFFIRFVLMSAMQSLPEAQRKSMHEVLRPRWAKMVAGAILFLLVSGIVNFVLTWKAFKLPPLYHMLFGMKVLLALAIFMLASLLSGKTTAAQKIRKKLGFWLTLNVIMAVTLVGISGVLRSIEKKPKPQSPPAAAAHVVVEPI